MRVGCGLAVRRRDDVLAGAEAAASAEMSVGLAFVRDHSRWDAGGPVVAVGGRRPTSVSAYLRRLSDAA